MLDWIWYYVTQWLTSWLPGPPLLRLKYVPQDIPMKQKFIVSDCIIINNTRRKLKSPSDINYVIRPPLVRTLTIMESMHKELKEKIEQKQAKKFIAD